MNIKISIMTIFVVFVFAFSAAAYCDYCSVNENGEVEGCGVLINNGDPMQPTLAFVVKDNGGTRVWELGVRVLLDQWVTLNGGAELEIDGVGYDPLELKISRKAQIKEGLVSESAYFHISESMVEVMAGADDQVVVKVSADESDPIQITLGAARLVELNGLLAEAKEKL